MDTIARAYAWAGLLPVNTPEVQGDSLVGVTPKGHLVWAALDGTIGEAIRLAAGMPEAKDGLFVPWATLIELDGDMADLSTPEHLAIARSEGLWRGFPEIVANVGDTYALWMHIVQPLEGEVLHIGVRPDMGPDTDDALATVGFSMLMERAQGIAPPLLNIEWQDEVVAAIFGEVE